RGIRAHVDVRGGGADRQVQAGAGGDRVGRGEAPGGGDLRLGQRGDVEREATGGGARGRGGHHGGRRGGRLGRLPRRVGRDQGGRRGERLGGGLQRVHLGVDRLVRRDDRVLLGQLVLQVGLRLRRELHQLRDHLGG